MYDIEELPLEIEKKILSRVRKANLKTMRQLLSMGMKFHQS
jgi:hypothetical protein